jgi:carboxyl-terminal processing protease
MAKFWVRTAALVGAAALLPAVNASFAATDVATYRELDQFMNVFERVRQSYVDKVDDKTLMRGAIEGMLQSLDPHSSYLDERDYKQLRVQMQGSYEGLGLGVTMEDGVVKVIAPTEDTPAWRAGIKAGDYIGMTLDEAVEKMRGKPGTAIKLQIVRPGRDKPIDLAITREVIQLRPVKWEVRDRVGIIDINTFSEPTTPGVVAAIAGIDKAVGGRPLGYIIDLRSNPGGALNQAIDVSDVFLSRGEIVSQRGRDNGDIERYYAKQGDLAHGLPVVVLVDAGSASAAEIVAGALQDHRRGLILGERSFGKGSVQSLLPITDDTAIKVTTARYYTPAGRSIQEGGIQPDIAVPQLSDPDYRARPRLREADLRRHLVNNTKADDSIIEEDAKPDPRFIATAEGLEKAGVKDFQMDYAVKTIARLAGQPQPVGGVGKAAR